MLKTLLNDKTTALLAIVAMLCLTVLMALGKLTIEQLEGALKWIFGTPVVASILNKLYNSKPSEPPVVP